MGVTGYEVRMYQDITSIARSLEKIAKALSEPTTHAVPAPGTLPKLPQEAFNLETDRARSSCYECPECHAEVDTREARAL